MNEAQLLKSIGFPKTIQIMKTLPYNQMENKLTPAQKKVISEHVVSRGIRILAMIQTSNTNIDTFESETERYDSIVFLAINVKDLKKAVQIYKVFMSIMPNPLVILFFDGVRTRWVFTTHEKKKDGFLACRALYEIQEVVTLQNVEEQLYFENLNKTNLKTFYESWLEQLLQLELQARYNIYITISLKNNLLAKLVLMDTKIHDYVKQAKKETQLNKCVELQQAANKLKHQKQTLIEKEQNNGK
ncbi:hypothetical protein VL07_11330 [Bacillus safensis]|uniref:DUF4391 domain-containing protein n=1 Tax=Bacillus safensis TaxID=561879 RepID=UPI0006520053|nr:DUF4391 domain-containing protein [Bacillus safensis]KML11175.1 hypothetical protein VL07_11330 [Bacillus safensis]KML52978.1 hypothetical protein VL18_01400 [Bacillus safensis]KMN79550.1 hypothetical protein VK99_07820 [Bacillus safensis]